MQQFACRAAEFGELVAAFAQHCKQYDTPFCAATAKRVAEQNGVVAGAVGCVDALLQMRAHVDAKIVEAHGHILYVDGMRGVGDDFFNLSREDLADDRFESHKKTAFSF